MSTYRHILCATDFSEDSERACARASELSAQLDAHLTLLHVVDKFPEQRSNETIAPEDEDPKHFREQEAHRHLTKLAQRLGRNDVRQEVRFSMRTAWHEVVDFAKEKEVDLIVIAEPVHHGMNKLMSSTAEKVFTHVPCDVLIVPSTDVT